jgi:hypothetical protein
VLDKVTDGGNKVMFLLSDAFNYPGDDNKIIIQLCRTRNAKKDVHIYTFLYDSGEDQDSVESEKLMKQIAEENGGKYKKVKDE